MFISELKGCQFKEEHSCFKTLAISVAPLLLCLSEETPKTRKSLLSGVHMLGEVRYLTHAVTGQMGNVS